MGAHLHRERFSDGDTETIQIPEELSNSTPVLTSPVPLKRTQILSQITDSRPSPGPSAFSSQKTGGPSRANVSGPGSGGTQATLPPTSTGATTPDYASATIEVAEGDNSEPCFTVKASDIAYFTKFSQRA